MKKKTFLYVLIPVIILLAAGAYFFVRKGNVSVVNNASNVAGPVINSTQSADNNSFSFAIIGDTKSFRPDNPNGNLQKAVRLINEKNVDLVMTEGDLVSSCDGKESCVKKYDQWKEALGSLLAKTYEVVGNHDRTGGSKADKVWQDEFNLPTNGPDGFPELVYSFDAGNAHFAVLDSEKPKQNIINQAQRDWLEKDLIANQKENIFIFFHEPAFQTTQKEKDGLDAVPEERDALWNIFKKYNVTAVFNGHEHIYSRKNVDGIQQIVVGNTDSTNDDDPGAGLSDFAYKGQSFAIVSVTGTKINLSLYSVDGKLVDSFGFGK